MEQKQIMDLKLRITILLVTRNNIMSNIILAPKANEVQRSFFNANFTCYFP